MIFVIARFFLEIIKQLLNKVRRRNNKRVHGIQLTLAQYRLDGQTWWQLIKDNLYKTLPLIFGLDVDPNDKAELEPFASDDSKY